MRVHLLSVVLIIWCFAERNLQSKAKASDGITLTKITISCNTKKAVLINQVSEKTISDIQPGIIIYKTKANYYDKVPVSLSDDKSTLVSPDKYISGEVITTFSSNPG